MKPNRSQGLLAVGSAALIVIYAAGYARTDEAARRMSDAGKGRRPVTDDKDPQVVRAISPPAAASAGAPASPHPAPAPSVEATTQAAQAVVQQAVLTPAAPASPPRFVFSSEGISLVTQPDGPARLITRFIPSPSVGSRPVKEALADLPHPLEKWQDGRWFGWGTCPHGTLKVEVEIVGGQITECSITECHTNYDSWAVRNLTGQVVARQSYNIGSMSGATQSSDAFYYGVVGALQAAKKAAM